MKSPHHFPNLISNLDGMLYCNMMRLQRAGKSVGFNNQTSKSQRLKLPVGVANCGLLSMLGHSIILTSKTKSLSGGSNKDSSTAVYFLLLIKLAPVPINPSGSFRQGVCDISSRISANVWQQ